MDLDMQNRIMRIDQRLSRAICAEVADRLRIVLTKELRTRFRRAAETPFNIVLEARP